MLNGVYTGMNSRNNKTNPRIPSDDSMISDMIGFASNQSLDNLANAANKNNITYNIMNKSNLSKLTKNQLIALLLEKQRPVPKPRTKKVSPIPTPRRIRPTPYPRLSVKQMVQNYENNIIKPPMQFRDRPQPLPRNNIIPPPIQFKDQPTPAPRVKNIISKPYPVPAPRLKKQPPIPLPKTEITETARAFQGYTKSYSVRIKNETDPLIQMGSTRLAIKTFLKKLLPQMRGIKFIETLSIYFEQKKEMKLSPEWDISIVNQKQSLMLMI